MSLMLEWAGEKVLDIGLKEGVSGIAGADGGIELLSWEVEGAEE